MLKIAFLCSGGGGNLKFVAHAIRAGVMKDTVICGVITDRECPANQFARSNNIWTSQTDFSLHSQIDIISQLRQLEPDVIVTTVHKILSAEIVEAFEHKLINLHYSLLPAFGGHIGQKPLRLALEHGVHFVGTTVHRVSNALDEGMPLMQAVVAVKAADTVESLMDTVFRSGCICLAGCIEILRPGRPSDRDPECLIIDIHGRTVLLNPALSQSYSSVYKTDAFWKMVKA
ncbi:MAG: hypothetical protein A3J24_00705 [Deltaproteobacteria bacterium RIFCSPLOWO2_02_FULL_53_8]|nr:MAG: hypothetical protein A3J24_00705 [Deltaproteobacteria bacterium RIFCSPLOWO2_02_FULL_53_8]